MRVEKGDLTYSDLGYNKNLSKEIKGNYSPVYRGDLAQGDLKGTYPRPNVDWSAGYSTLDDRYLKLTGGNVGNSEDYIEFGEDGTMTFIGNASYWDDIRVTPGGFDRPGVSDPTLIAYDVGGGGLATYIYEFDKNDIASFTVQLPHGYKEGGNIYAHIHWTPGSRGVAESGNYVGWKLDYSWANINGTFTAMQTLDLSDVCDGENHKHQMTPEGEITGSGKNISSMLICNIKRTDLGTEDTWVSGASGQQPLLLEVDFHYPIDSVGSTEIHTKETSPSVSPSVSPPESSSPSVSKSKSPSRSASLSPSVSPSVSLSSSPSVSISKSPSSSPSVSPSVSPGT